MTGEDAGAGHVPAPVRRAGWAATGASLLVFGALVSEGSPSGLLRRGPFTSDFFDEQAAALLAGRLAVDPDVAGLEGFVHDGETHLYFGLFPALLRVPVVAVTERFDGRLTQLSMLLALTVACWAATRLAWRARRWRRGEAAVDGYEPWIVGAFTATVGLASPLLFLASRPVVYHETELWGAALALVAADAALGWWERPGPRPLAWAAGTATATLSTRGSVGLGTVVGLGLVLALALLVRRVPRRRAPALALAAVAPLVPYAAVNQARFGHPVDIPFRAQVLSSFDPARQATLESTGGSLFGAEFAPTALLTYLRPDGVELQRLFPWVTFREATTVLGSPTFDTIDRSASLPVVAPALLLLAVVGLACLPERGWREPWPAVAAGAVAGMVPTLTIAFIAQRYLADAVPALVVLAAVGTWVVADRLAGAGPRVRTAALAGLAGLTAAATLASLALALQSQRLFILPSEPARTDFVAFQYDLHDRLWGGPPPGVELADDLRGPPGRRGTVVVAGACRGLYWSDGRRWWPLELGGADGLAVRTSALPVGRTALLEGGGWTLVAEVEPGRARLRYEGPVERTGDWFDRGALRGPLAVALDRVNGELTVRSSTGHPLLVAWLVDLAGPVEAAGGTVRSLATPLCDDLVARLEA